MDACRFGGAQAGTQIVWILDAVQYQQQRRPVNGFENAVQVFFAEQIFSGEFCDDVLVPLTFATPFQQGSRLLHYRNSKFPGKATQLENPRVVAFFGDSDEPYLSRLVAQS